MTPLEILSNPLFITFGMKLINMFADKKIDASELNELIFDALKLAGVNMKTNNYWIFTEMDGDVHIILKKAALDRIKVQM